MITAASSPSTFPLNGSSLSKLYFPSYSLKFFALLLQLKIKAIVSSTFFRIRTIVSSSSFVIAPISSPSEIHACFFGSKAAVYTIHTSLCPDILHPSTYRACNPDRLLPASQTHPHNKSLAFPAITAEKPLPDAVFLISITQM